MLVALLSTLIATLAVEALIPSRYISTELVRLYNKEEEKLPYAPVLSVDDVFKRNALLDQLIPPARLHEAISLLPQQLPDLGMSVAQIEANVQTQVVRDTPFIEIKVQSSSKKNAETIAGLIAANLLLLQIEKHEPLNLHMESITQVSSHLLTPTQTYFALPLALLVALLMSSLAASGWLKKATRRIPLALVLVLATGGGLLVGVTAALCFPIAFLMLAMSALSAALALVRFRVGFVWLAGFAPLP